MRIVPLTAALILGASAAAAQVRQQGMTEAQRLRAQNDSLRRLVDSLSGAATRPVASKSMGVPAPDMSRDASLAPSSDAAPFGLTMGMSEKAVRALVRLDSVKGQRGVFTAARLPKSLSDFESYQLVISPKQGLCKMAAVGRDIRAGAYGTDLLLTFNNISDMVSERYGQGERIDHVLAGSMWDQPRDWMMGLRQKERTLSTMWDAEEGSRIPVTIKAIVLEASALSGETGFLRLSFEFTNFTSCLAELKANPF